MLSPLLRPNWRRIFVTAVKGFPALKLRDVEVRPSVGQQSPQHQNGPEPGMHSCIHSTTGPGLQPREGPGASRCDMSSGSDPLLSAGELSPQVNPVADQSKRASAVRSAAAEQHNYALRWLCSSLSPFIFSQTRQKPAQDTNYLPG